MWDDDCDACTTAAGVVAVNGWAGQRLGVGDLEGYLAGQGYEVERARLGARVRGYGVGRWLVGLEGEEAAWLWRLAHLIGHGLQARGWVCCGAASPPELAATERWATRFAGALLFRDVPSACHRDVVCLTAAGATARQAAWWQRAGCLVCPERGQWKGEDGYGERRGRLRRPVLHA